MAANDKQVGGKKNGVQDLEKARHFLDKYIELAETEECDYNVND